MVAQIIEGGVNENDVIVCPRNHGNTRKTGSANVSVADMALLVRLIVHWDHREVVRFSTANILPDGTMEDTTGGAEMLHNLQEVDSSSICRVGNNNFSMGTS